MKEKDEYYMRLAIQEAHKALERGEVPIGAVVVAGDRVVARAYNLTETLSDATAHAEMQAITAAAATIGSKYLKGCTLYVTVELCPMCAAASYWSQVERIVFGAEDPKRGYSTIDGKLLHPKTSVTSGVLAAECGELMTNFFKKLRK